jgi:hypothetical protein
MRTWSNTRSPLIVYALIRTTTTLRDGGRGTRSRQPRQPSLTLRWQYLAQVSSEISGFDHQVLAGLLKTFALRISFPLRMESRRTKSQFCVAYEPHRTDLPFSTLGLLNNLHGHVSFVDARLSACASALYY